MIGSFDKLDKDTKMLLFDELMKKFNLYKVYYHQHSNKSWKGYRASDIKDIYRCCKELYEFFITSDYKEKSPVSTAGFNIFIKNGSLYINYENRLNHESIGYTKPDALIIASIDYMGFLRTIKIKKIENDNKRRDKTIY